MLKGYKNFRQKYTEGDSSVMGKLADHGQQPKTMMVACCDSRVDPSVILQCDPGELFITRNVANIVPPYEQDLTQHGTSAALEFGICYLNVKHLIILGHSNCGGMHALLNSAALDQNDFISRWVSLIKVSPTDNDTDTLAKHALLFSYQNCLTFPWIKERLKNNLLEIHLWFFDIKTGEILVYSHDKKDFYKLTDDTSQSQQFKG